MTSEQAIEKYTDRFGGFPYMLFMGAADDYIVKAVEKAIKSGKPIEAKKGKTY